MRQRLRRGAGRAWPAALLLMLLAAAMNAQAADDDDDDDDEEDVPAAAAPAPVPPPAPLIPAPQPAAPPRAATPDTRPLLANQPIAPSAGTTLAVGGGGLMFPRYPGSKVTAVSPWPYAFGSYGSWFSFDTFDGLRARLLSDGGFSAGIAARPRFGRHTHDAERVLHGLRTIGDTAEIGGYVAYRVGDVTAEVIATQDAFNQHGGMVADARLFATREIGPVEVEFGPMVRGVTQRYARAFYGIDPSRVAANGNGPYRASGGLERAGVEVSAEWELTQRVTLSGFVDYGRLLGDAAGSPMVKRYGSANQVYGGLFLTYRLY